MGNNKLKSMKPDYGRQVGDSVFEDYRGVESELCKMYEGMQVLVDPGKCLAVGEDNIPCRLYCGATDGLPVYALKSRSADTIRYGMGDRDGYVWSIHERTPYIDKVFQDEMDKRLENLFSQKSHADEEGIGFYW